MSQKFAGPQSKKAHLALRRVLRSLEDDELEPDDVEMLEDFQRTSTILHYHAFHYLWRGLMRRRDIANYEQEEIEKRFDAMLAELEQGNEETEGYSELEEIGQQLLDTAQNFSRAALNLHRMKQAKQAHERKLILPNENTPHQFKAK